LYGKYLEEYYMIIKVGDRVRVGPEKPNGEPHPQAGKTGVVRELMGVLLTGPGWPPRAQVTIDAGFPDAGNIMIVSVVCLEKI
jgi:hypothetical protein